MIKKEKKEEEYEWILFPNSWETYHVISLVRYPGAASKEKKLYSRSLVIKLSWFVATIVTFDILVIHQGFTVRRYRPIPLGSYYMIKGCLVAKLSHILQLWMQLIFKAFPLFYPQISVIDLFPPIYWQPINIFASLKMVVTPNLHTRDL